ncbi:porin [Testudinibacter sp. TR-2022]|uniref:porin n=1 Tax=Testudinibacter sp. TR-2022 TaxID=2585029 RepID=UPI001118A322|nr:porin [Testudinibacter sp. TR-2022]TNH11286.1 porin [Testudinibacter sp. TR-2022]TNH14800.1 porin [Testudinibacter sp. TR-2022]
MKKTLIALSVAAVAATSANAAVVYDQDGAKVEVGGSLRVLLSKDSGERADLKNKGSRLVVKGSQDLGSGLSALANIEFRFEKDNENGFNDVETKRLYAGFKQDGVGTITFGRQLTNLDDVGLSDYTYDLGGVNQTQTSANKSVKFRSAEWSGFSFGLDYMFGEADKKEYNNKAGWGAALFYTADLAANTQLNLNGGFSQVKSNNVAEHKENAFTVGSELVVDKFAIAVDYSQNKSTNGVDSITYRSMSNNTVSELPFNKKREIGLGLKYQYLDNASIYGQYIWGRADQVELKKAANLRAWIVGADYKLHKNVVTYVEGGSFKAKYNAEIGGGKEIDNYAGVGLRVFF